MTNIDLSRIHFNSALIAKELLKRGITIHYLGETNIIEAYYKGHKEVINETDLSIMPSTYRSLFDDKGKTKKILNEKGFSTVKGAVFSPVESNLALEYVINNLEYPVVVKDVHGTHGYQVKMNIYSDIEFINAFEFLAKSSNYQVDILVEQQVFLNEFRISVTKNGFFASVNRRPANVTGDGIKTLRKLIEEINFQRVNFRTTCLCEIWIDDELINYLSKKGLNLDYIPKNGELVFLRSNSNISTGGDCIDVTEFVCDEYKKIAFGILNEFQGLPYIGIDVLTEDISVFGEYYICELNPSPGISIHTHPGIGKPRDFTKALVDILFPETINLDKFDNYNRFILNSNFKTIKEIGENFTKIYPEKYFYKPLQIELELTNLCNFRCPKCAILDDVKKQEFGLDTKTIIKILNDASKLGIYTYSLTGGEPFMRFDDMCNIINQVENIDCYKIQTNGSFFDTDKKSKLYFKKLSESGFGVKNKYIKPSLRISFGISNGEQKNYWDKIKYSSKNFYNFFDSQKTTLGFVVSDDVENIEYTKKKFIDEFKEKTNLDFDDEKYYFRSIYVQPGMKNIDRISLNNKNTIHSFLEENKHIRPCFKTNDNIPWPKLLIKANGDVYSCVCFSQVFLMGNVKKDSLKDIIDKINKSNILKIIDDKGLLGFLDYVEKINPGVGNIEIPNNFTKCNVCKILKESIKNS